MVVIDILLINPSFSNSIESVTTLTEIGPTVGSTVEQVPLGQYTRPGERHDKHSPEDT
jgi:hypothetical protein